MRLAMIQMSNSGSVEKNMEKSLHENCRSSRKREQSLCCSRKVQLTEFFPQYLGKGL